MNFRKAFIYLFLLATLVGVGYFIMTMKDYADGVIEDSQRIEELRKTGAFDNQLNISKDSVQQTAIDSVNEVDSAKKWLTTTIVKFYDQDSRQHFREITTEQYAEYKQDALCVVYDCDNSLTEEQFEKKWSDTYDISYAGFGESFLTGQQDWGNIIMSKCELASELEQGTYIFDTVVEDTMFELTYAIGIVVKQTPGGFKIDDIRKEK